MKDHLAYLSKKRFSSLDGLRAISIIAVIWHHSAPKWVDANIIHIGAYGVTLFFAISGFLITTLLLREREHTGRINTKAFYMRRVLRILPLYFGVLLIYIFVVATMEKDPAIKQGFFDNLVYFATYTSNLFVKLDGRVIFYFSWSLAAEEQFYLVWPPLLYLIAKTSKEFILLSIVMAALILDRIFFASHILGFIPLAIVGGSLLAVSLHTKRGFDILNRFLGQYWSVFVVIALLIAALSLKAPSMVIHILGVLLVGSCVIREDHPVAGILTLKWISYIGGISYGMYMMHMLCLNGVTKMLSVIGWDSKGFEIFIFTVLVSVLIASLSFKYYESYFLKLKDRFNPQLIPKPSSVSATDAPTIASPLSAPIIPPPVPSTFAQAIHGPLTPPVLPTPVELELQNS
ncbi:MAG: acyltransferase family protein [Chitinophagales bacterium]